MSKFADWLLDGPLAPLLIIVAVLLVGAALLAPVLAVWFAV